MPRQRKSPERFEGETKVDANRNAARKSKQKKVEQQRKRREEAREIKAARAAQPADPAADGLHARSPAATPDRKKIRCHAPRTGTLNHLLAKRPTFIMHM